MAGYGVKLLCFMAIFRTAAGFCYGSAYLATTTRSFIYDIYYSNNVNCTINIRPVSSRAGSHYLEISWDRFDIKGRMPQCGNDYVEVFLTRSYKSIGKFCSNNMQSKVPFNMYSPDGYARLIFYSDSSVTGKGFEFYYQLKRKKYNYLGSIDSTSCSPSNSYTSSSTIYSQGWPRSYQNSSVSCTYKINSGGTDLRTRVVLMDIDLWYKVAPDSCSTDYIQLKGANSNRNSLSANNISGKLCSKTQMKIYDTSYKYLFIDFHRQTGSNSSLGKGFMAGYVTYSTALPPKVPDLSRFVGIAIGCILGIVALLLILAFGIYFWQNRIQNKSAAAPVPMTNIANSTQTNSNVALNPSYQTSSPQSDPTSYPQTAGNVGSADASSTIGSSGNLGQYPPAVSQGYVAPVSDGSHTVPPSAVASAPPQPTGLGAANDPSASNAPPPVAVSQ